VRQILMTMERGMTTPAMCLVSLLTVGFCLGPATADGQPGATRGPGALVGVFERNAPAVGDRLPNLPVYDREGQQHRLTTLLRGRYTVLVLGCLT